jgi:hypothetical protein
MGDLISAASKLGVGSIFRIGLSGLILVVLLLPVQNPLVPDFLKIDELSDILAIVIPEALILGMFLTLFRNVIYRIYEGRLLWPDRLHASRTARIQRQVEKRLSEAESLDRSSVRYKELWFWLRLFPLNAEGKPTAVRPTLLGNILEGYETYPNRRYNMDSIFYWYRLWPTLPEEFRNQADMASASADTLMFASMSALVSGMAFMGLAALELLNGAFPAGSILTFTDVLPPATWLFGLGVFYVGLCYMFYRFSIPLHRSNGEFYKAAFDLYRNNIKGMTKISEEEKTDWYKTWAYLQYLLVQCQRCKRYFFAGLERCPHCHRRKS